MSQFSKPSPDPPRPGHLRRQELRWREAQSFHHQLQQRVSIFRASSVFVVTNSLRLRGLKDTAGTNKESRGFCARLRLLPGMGSSSLTCPQGACTVGVGSARVNKHGYGSANRWPNTPISCLVVTCSSFQRRGASKRHQLPCSISGSIRRSGLST